ncbi:DegT/DnrJ/EryC1/StrS family aminotransferase [Enterococcus pseudoavium]|uniref:DegT/DnrJ/EryC1/StrS family aminotransferase n=1 Tax=Enterococcus pseudoavium TaxID=44007 RepID=UPI00082D3932|nr:DegT/DnrJ/EryC1/StrS family aminotransferase [Enterococcus pseudoavium]REC32399.1 DegT/DnrJ/EryC1/StrS family aminotransferase [Enterococcus pseudoavium]
MENIYVTKASMPPIDEFIAEIEDIWSSHWLTNQGVKVQTLEKKMEKIFDTKNISLFVNGHMALELLIQAMNLTGEVITTPYTFASTTHAIVRNNLTPVFCDIKSDDFTLDPKKIENLITDKTSAILPVHVYGNVCDVEAIQKIADDYGLKVIYDAAHVFGTRYKEKSIANFGDASMFSFHATKVFNTIEGGAICYKDIDMGEKLYRLKNFGIQGEEIVDGVGSNAKMNEFQAAMGICNLKYQDAEIAKRKEIVMQYRQLLSGIPGVTLNSEQSFVTSNYSYFPIIIDEKKYGITRNRLIGLLQEQNIYPRKYFYPITSSYDCYKDKFDTAETPIALYMSKRVMALPLYASLSEVNVERICRIIKKNQK